MTTLTETLGTIVGVTYEILPKKRIILTRVFIKVVFLSTLVFVRMFGWYVLMVNFGAVTNVSVRLLRLGTDSSEKTIDTYNRIIYKPLIEKEKPND